MGVPISNVPRRVVLAASGTGPYNFTFEILAATDIAVYRDDTLLTLTTNYTVTINANGTGYVTLTAAPTGATQIAIVGNRTIQRTTDFVTGGDFFANTVNDEMDQQTIFAQQNAEGLARALQAPQTDPTSINMVLPRKADRANKTLAFDADGNPSIGVSAADVANALTYATNAANSATAAASSASAASASASSASTSASTATTQASNASTSATNAANSASSASTSASNAASSASSAATSASNASTSATNAASSASSASTSASTATTQATNAATSATNAANSASTASTQASNAASSATAAAASAAAAAASYDSFDDRYLGTKASDPTLDNDGNALVTGALYYNTTTQTMKVYDGANWIAATAAGTTSMLRYRYVATSGQTTFSGADANSATLSYTSGNIIVARNGVMLDPSEYTATNGTSVVLTAAAATGDVIDIVAFKSFTVADTYTKAEVDTSLAGKQAASNTLTSYAANGVGLINRILNGDMRIDQRNAGASQTPTADDTFNVDRWAAGINVASKFSMQQNTADAPTTQGFSHCVKITSLSAYSLAAGDVAVFKQTIEGTNIADLSWGTASAKTVTLSFWVRSSLTGTFGGTLMNSAQNRAYPFTYTISAANTWEQKTITIAGDTSGTWLTTTGAGIKLGFQLGVGSTFTGTAGSWSGSNLWGATGATNVLGTNGATWYLTGVQLEKGSQATPFQVRDYCDELLRCQRYYERRTVGSQNNERLATTGLSNGSASAQFPIQHIVQKRGTPAINVGNLSNTSTYDGTASGTPTAWSVDNTGIFITNIQLTGLTTALGRAIHWSWANTTPTPFVEISAEL